ncbi:hypothetical protein E2R60_18495 [Paenibacillus dendritiformis]|nr:hypothetical protein E2R60_18495 [Paenibacillus dendritiformis]
MRALINTEIKAIHIFSEDWGDEPEDFCVKLEADIGIEGINGSEIFKFTIISPKYLGKLLTGNEVKVGRGLLITNDFNINKVEHEIEKIIKACSSDSWDKTSLLLSRFAQWEYDYE